MNSKSESLNCIFQHNQLVPDQKLFINPHLPMEPIFLDDDEPVSDPSSNFILSFQTQEAPQQITPEEQRAFLSLSTTFHCESFGYDFVKQLLPPENHDNASQDITKDLKIPLDKIIKRKQKLWTQEEDNKLRELYDCCQGKWSDIAKNLPQRNASQCQQRWRRIHPVKNCKKVWTPADDERLVELVQKCGKQWKKIAELIGNITGKQARERFINKLDNKIKKDPWSEEEDKIVLNYYTEHGPRWTQISALLPGRPENHVKNRFYSYIQRNYLGQTNRYQIVYTE